MNADKCGGTERAGLNLFVNQSNMTTTAEMVYTVRRAVPSAIGAAVRCCPAGRTSVSQSDRPIVILSAVVVRLCWR